MGLGKFKYENKPVEPDIVRAAEDVFPNLWQGEVATEYRLLIIKEFLDRDGVPPKPNRTRNETRFDRAVYALDDVIEVDGKGTIGNCAVGMYDERDGATAQFIADLVEIEERASDECATRRSKPSRMRTRIRRLFDASSVTSRISSASSASRSRSRQSESPRLNSLTSFLSGQNSNVPHR